MRAIVLGSAAGGGFPQWNDNTAASCRARRGDPLARPRSQASLAVSANNRDWFVLNASPDLRQQIEATPALHPRDGRRSSPIAGVVLTGGDVDAIAGLLHLRERHRFTIYAPARGEVFFRTGDIVKFVAISRAEYDELQASPRPPRSAPTSFGLEEFEADPDGYNARLLEVLG